MVDSIFAGEQFFRFFAGDLAAVAIGHDLHVLVFQSVKSPDDKRQDKADRGEDDIGEPQAVESVGGLRVAGDGVPFGEFFKALHTFFGDFEAEHGKQCKSERAGDGGGELGDKGLDGESDALSVYACFEFAVFCAVRREHKHHNADDSERNGFDHAQTEIDPLVVAGDKEHQNAHSRHQSHADHIYLHFVEFADERGDKQRADEGGRHGEQGDDESEHGIAEYVERRIGIERSAYGEPGIEDYSEIIYQQIFVADKIFQHRSDRKIGVRRGVVSLFCLKAEREHDRHADRGHHQRRHPIGQSDAFAHQDVADDICQHGACAAPNAAHRHHSRALVHAVGHRVYQAVEGDVAERIYGVPKDICDGEPSDLAAFFKSRRDAEEKYGGDGHQDGREFEPGNVLFAAFEAQFVEDHAEQRVIDRVPYLDRK